VKVAGLMRDARQALSCTIMIGLVQCIFEEMVTSIGASCSNDERNEGHESRNHGKERDCSGLFHRLHAGNGDPEDNTKNPLDTKNSQ